MSMTDILIKAIAFASIILVGYLLRQKGFFKEEDFYVLSKIVLKITLPAAIVANFSTMELEVSMLSICLFGLSGGVILIGFIWLINTGKPNERKGFDVLNVAGYNIGNFTMPFIQGFLGTTGLAAASLFDTGNSIICLGGACSMAMAAMRTGQKQTIRDLVRPLLKSVPFIAYVTMTILTLMNIRLPKICISFAQTVGGANAFLALLMVGVGFKLSFQPDKIATIFRVLSVRYGISIVLAVVFYLFAPFELEIRQAFAVLVFSPIASAAPAYAGELGMDVGLSSVINSLSVVISIILMTGTLIIIL